MLIEIKMSSRGNCEERSRTRDLSYINKLDYPYINIHTHTRTGEGIELVSAMALSGELPSPPCSVGIHPWQAGQIDMESALREVASARVSAVGEIGLDYSRPIPHELHAEVFEKQLRIAAERGLPVILHCVRAFEPVMSMLAKHTLRAVIFHGFTGSRQQAARATEAGYWLSFGERSLASPKTVEAMKSMDVSKMFFETDDSALSIAEVYSRAAILMRADKAEIKREVYNNYIRIFGQ